ncbi:conserved hypothetical protein, secreted [Candidatus Magnetobacterium bavaricum]|uniref:DUF4384 domain-containing protein n=1 Tax=Candidatus Magnetobacterium bavaricum TaxID=29290 RepID=A0A0F3GRJ5_9BACT|nr:conserved hypothetical protein, secreted [Candidatus Magnetobacterium bavaricum]
MDMFTKLSNKLSTSSRLSRLLVVILIAGVALAASCTTVYVSARPQYVTVGPNWSSLYNLSQGRGINVSVSGLRAVYLLGDNIGLYVTSDTTGRVWIITVGQDDQPELVFPNPESPDNNIMAGIPLAIPPRGSPWRLTAGKPVGNSLLFVLITDANITEDDVEAIINAKSGHMTNVIKDTLPRWGSAKEVINIRYR